MFSQIKKFKLDFAITKLPWCRVLRWHLQYSLTNTHNKENQVSSQKRKKKKREKKYLIWKVGNHSLFAVHILAQEQDIGLLQIWLREIKDTQLELGLYSKRNIEINNKALRLSKVLKKSRRDLNNGEMKDSIQQLLNPSEQIHILLLPSLFFLLCLCVCSVRDCCACVRLVRKSRRESFRNQGERQNCCVCVFF